MIRFLLLTSPLAVLIALIVWAGDPELLWYRVTTLSCEDVAYPEPYWDPSTWHQALTSLKAIKAVYTLPEEHVTEFLESYQLFEQEGVTNKDHDAAKTVNYYKVLNHLCAIGEVEKMYIPPVMDLSKGVFQNQLIWEEKGVADKLHMGPKSRVLDMGCGRGRVAHHMASYSGAHVTGINIDHSQVRMAKEGVLLYPYDGEARHANITNMAHRLNFVQGNFNDPLPFEDETFDALYQVQVLTYTLDADKLFKEMYRILKPGAKLSFLDYVSLPNYDPSDPQHKELLLKVKPLLGAVWTPTPADFTKPLEKAGFKILMNEDASLGGHQYPLIEKAEVFFTAVRWLLRGLTKLHLIPPHFLTLFERLTKDGEAFIEADKMGLFTTSWQIIAQKPA